MREGEKQYWEAQRARADAAERMLEVANRQRQGWLERAFAAEADVARLRELLAELHEHACVESQNRSGVCCSVVDALATTEPR